MVSARSLLGLQGIYYCVTGTWALVHIGSFIRVTGPKTDIWLVKTVGALVLAAGTVMVKAAFGSGPRGHAYDLATAMALAFAAVEAWYTSTGRISKVYAADALVELALAVGIRAGRREDTEGTVAESPRDFRTLIDAGPSGS